MGEYEVGGFNVEYPMIKGKIDGIDSYLYDVDKMISIYDRERPRVVIIASPNNPTGNNYAILGIFFLIFLFDIEILEVMFRLPLIISEILDSGIPVSFANR